MSLIYWEKVLAGDPVIPFDVTFQIVTQADADHADETAVPPSFPMISAHKLILGLSSAVFRSQLYGEWKGGKEVIEVKEVAFSVFRTMISYIYGIPLPYSVEFLSLENVQELFDLVDTAKKYLIPQLAQEIVALINKAAISTNTIEVQGLVRLAKQYSHLEEASSALLAKCEEEMKEAEEEAKMVKRVVKLSVRSIRSINIVNVNLLPITPMFPIIPQVPVLPIIPQVPLLPFIPQIPMLLQAFGDLAIFEYASENEEDVEIGAIGS